MLSNVWQELLEQGLREQLDRTVDDFPTQHNFQTMQQVLNDLRREQEVQRMTDNIEREIDGLRTGRDLAFAQAHTYMSPNYLNMRLFDIDHLLDEKRNIVSEVKNEDELFELFIKKEISEETYLYYLPKFQMSKQERMIQQVRSKPRIKDKLKRLKPWQ